MKNETKVIDLYNLYKYKENKQKQRIIQDRDNIRIVS